VRYIGIVAYGWDRILGLKDMHVLVDIFNMTNRAHEI